MTKDNTTNTISQDTQPAPSDLLTEITNLPDQLEPDLKRAEKAAHFRELRTSLGRAVAAIEHLVHIYEAEEPSRDADEEEEDTDDDPTPKPGMAILSDGSVAIESSYLEGADLAGRKMWLGVILSAAETADAVDRLSDAADETAALCAGYVIHTTKKRDPETLQ